MKLRGRQQRDIVKLTLVLCLQRAAASNPGGSREGVQLRIIKRKGTAGAHGKLQ